MLIDFKNLNLNQLPSGTEFEKKVNTFLKDWFSDKKTVPVQTSGSTGIPKTFEIEKSKMIASAEMTCKFLELKEGDTALLCLPVEYISGKMMIVRSVVKSLKLIVKDPSAKPMQDNNEEIDFCAMTPLQVENSLDELHWINNLIIGGAAVSENLKNKIFSALGAKGFQRIFETYGMSETLSHIALKQIYPKSEFFFTAFENVEISTDERGCLRIFAPYLNAEFLQTNDLVEIKNNNQFRFLGRIDNVINSAGAKIFPEQLEALVKKEIQNEVAFLGIEDESLGQKLILIIEGEKAQDVIDQIKKMPFEKSFHRPKEIIFIKDMPRTPNGKINRIKLKATVSSFNQ